MSAAYLDKLNADQRRAVLHGVDEDTALLIIAGAGSGKTATLAHRVVHLVANGADPRRILLMTFSRRAAVEMTRRVERIGREAGTSGSGGAGARRGTLASTLPWAGTFHAIGARLLRDYAAQIGVDPAFTIHDREDSADLMNLVRHDLGFSAKENRFPTKATCLAIYSRAVNAEEDLAAVLMKAFPWCASWEDELRTLFAAYLDAKHRQHVLDYDDLLLYWAQMMCEPSIAADVAARFDHVLVDEYQDTNRLQASILMQLKPDGRGLTVVGDDAQAIYSFRAATVRNILDFPTQFREPASVVTLARNYRSTEPILAASNAVISLAAERFTKELWSGRASSDRPRLVTVIDEAEQARYVAHRVLENRERGSALKAQAVLFRASHHSAALGDRAQRSRHSLRQVRRAQIPRQRARQGPARLPALCREPARPRLRLPRVAAPAGHRARQGRPDPGGGRRRHRARRAARTRRGPRRMAGVCRDHPPPLAAARRLARRNRDVAALV